MITNKTNKLYNLKNLMFISIFKMKNKKIIFSSPILTINIYKLMKLNKNNKIACKCKNKIIKIIAKNKNNVILHIISF